MPEKWSEDRNVRELVAAAAGPQQFSDNRKSWLARAARNSGLSYRTIRAIFYGEIDDARHPAIQLLEARARTQALARRFETIARGLETIDADFHRASIDQLVDAARALRGVDRAGDRGD